MLNNHATEHYLRLLLHTETPDGSVIPVWEEVKSDNVSVLKDVMASRKYIADGVELGYARIPITAERPPDFSDLSELIDVVVRSSATGAPIVLNCQLGRGRSTLTSVCTLVYITSWHMFMQSPVFLGHLSSYPTMVEKRG